MYNETIYCVKRVLTCPVEALCITLAKRGKVKKTVQIGVRWAPPIKGQWEKLARDEFDSESSTLARDVLEEFLACFLTDEELRSAGLPSLAGRRPGGLISLALEKCDQQGNDRHKPGSKKRSR
jgi:hypothetical protein